MRQSDFFAQDINDDNDWEPNISGHKKLCKQIEDLLDSKVYREIHDYPSKAKEYVKGAPYQDMYGCKRRSAFLFFHPLYGLTRIEPHVQQTSGSVDLKFPFYLHSAERVKEPNVVFVFDGNGYKKEAFHWLEDKACQQQEKQILVFDNLPQLDAWLDG